MRSFRSSALVVIASLMLLACANSGQPYAPALIYMPPDQYLHSFPGTIVVSDLPGYSKDATASQVMAIAQVTSSDALNLHMCRIQIPPVDALDRKFRKCLFLVALANCNGAINVEAAADRKAIPAGYERTCSDYWSDTYDRLKPNPETGRD
jgi:hypothetical protein